VFVSPEPRFLSKQTNTTSSFGASHREARGGVRASRDLQERRAFTPEQKPAVLDLLNQWQHEVGADAFGKPLADLRLEMHADVNPHA
jgi:hypothetical protein